MKDDKKVTAMAVGGESKDRLLTWLAERPKTLGWDAIVVYNRGRANALLLQQYIKKLTADNYLIPIDGVINGGDGSRLNFYGIQLGLPRLSFENADIEHSRAKVTQAITAGLAILKSEPIGGYKSIHSIMRPTGVAGPTLWMDVDLSDTPGSVTEAGSVEIDLSKMKYFDTDLFSDRLSVINAQEFFRQRFEENPELHKYRLGTLSKTADSTLTPQNFKIRTQAVPGAKLRGAPNFGDGAVVLFVTLKGGTDGGMPTNNSDFKYLIPNDMNGTRYSSAVLLSNHVLFTKLILPQINASPPLAFELKSDIDQTGVPGHLYAQATQGAFTLPKDTTFSSKWEQGNDTHYSSLRSDEITLLKVTAADGKTGLRITATGNTINFSWKASTTSRWEQDVNVEGGNDVEHYGHFDFEIYTDEAMTPHVNARTGVIEFSGQAAASGGLSVRNFDWLEFFGFDNWSAFSRLFIDPIQTRFYDYFKIIKIPDIDIFLLKNLLFPDSNAMVLTDAYAPGDLAVFGNVDPSLTSFVITPEHPILLVGASRQFATAPLVTNVTWSARALPGDGHPFGSIDRNGLYTAPSADDLHDRDGQQVIVTATGTTARGTVASSSTVVSVIHQNITVNPMFCVTAPGLSQVFTAGTTDESELTWQMMAPGQGGVLNPAAGPRVTYTAPTPSNNTMFMLDVVEVRDTNNNLGLAEVLVVNGILGGQVTVDLADAALHRAKLQFEVSYNNGPIAIPPEYLTWTLLAGEGWVTPDNVYHAPEQERPGFALITCICELPPMFPGLPPQKSYGFTVLPLPLAAYPSMAKAYS